MKIAARFTPNAQSFINATTGIASGTFNATLPPGSGKMLIYNGSLIDLIFTFGVSTYQDIVPAQTARIFQFALADWGHIQWQSVLPVPAYTLAGVITTNTTCTVVVYENSEDIPNTFATTSYVDPFNVVIQAGRDIEFTGLFTGTGAFTLQTISTFSRPAYLQKIIVSILPNGSTGTGSLDLIDNIGNDLAHFWISEQNSTTTTALPYVQSIDFNPAIIYQLGTVQVKGSFSSISGTVNSRGTAVTMFTYYC